MKVVVQMLFYNEPFEEIDRMFASLERVDFPRDQWALVVVNNRFAGHDVAGHFEKSWRAKAGVTLPQVLFHSQENNGFTGGHNDAYRIAKTLQPEMIYLLNGDAEIDPGFLKAIVVHAEVHPNEAVIQSRVMLAQDPALLNTCGNCMHYLGFGYADGYREAPETAAAHPRPHFYASGAGVLLRCAMIEAVDGLFYDTFMYHEDVDISWRARLAGYDIGYAEDSVMFHRYEFSKSIKKFYWMERNRHLTNFVNYRLATLAFIAAPMLLMELGTFVYAVKSGWWKEKVRSWTYFLQPAVWMMIRDRRRVVARLRKVTDRRLLNAMVGTIEAQEVQNPIMDFLVNPVLQNYFALLKIIVRW